MSRYAGDEAVVVERWLVVGCHGAGRSADAAADRRLVASGAVPAAGVAVELGVSGKLQVHTVSGVHGAAFAFLVHAVVDVVVVRQFNVRQSLQHLVVLSVPLTMRLCMLWVNKEKSSGPSTVMWLFTAGLSALLPVPTVLAAAAAAAADGTAAEPSKPAAMPLHIAGHFLLSRSGARKLAWQVLACLQHCRGVHSEQHWTRCPAS